jgi:small subunit ribosomal protein S1
VTEEEMEERMSFAELLEANLEPSGRRFSVGDTVSGRVVKITRDTIFLDLGGKSEGFGEVHEFLDKDGNLTLREGDRVEMRVASTKNGIHLTKGIKVQGDEAYDILREAQQNLMPVEGRISAVKKGGFEVDFSGIRAFCPISQIDLKYCEKPEEHIGAKYSFRIMEVKEKGKNIVVSRRVLLEEEREKKSKEIMAMLKPDLVIEGTVTKVTDFGAFVDLGGVEGMVHVSEISRSRINHPSEVLKPNQPVKVKVMKIEGQRIGLSMKALEPDPWEAGLPIREGEIVRGRVSRLTDFGAFVEVAPGIDGLVHVSEISYERVSRPNQLLHEGDLVDVMVLTIDQQGRRISLSIKEAAMKKQVVEKGGDQVRLEAGQILRGIVDDIKPYGLFVRLPQLGPRVRGLLPVEELSSSEKGDTKKKFPKGREVLVEILSIDEKGRIRLSQKVMEDREDREDYKKFVEGERESGTLGSLRDLFKDLKLK